jgi:hypothetical protein
MSDPERQVVLFAPIRPSSIHEPHETSQEPECPLIEDLDDFSLPTSTAAYFLRIDPSWNALQLRTAYSHLLRANKDGEQEHPELLLHNVAQPRLLDFVQAIEIGFKHAESRAGGESLADAIEGAGCSRWLTEGDIERAIDWVVRRGREMNLDIGYEVPEGYQGVVLNRQQLGGRHTSRCPSPPARPIGGQDRAGASWSPVRQEGGQSDDDDDVDDEHRLHHDLATLDLDMTGSTADRAIALSDSDSDDDLASPKRKRRPRASSDDELVVTSSPTKKQRLREDSVAYVPSRTPTPSPSRSPRPSTTPNLTRNRSGSPARRTRWTAAQQFAMVSLLYTTGYEGADWEYIAGRVNAANPLGPAKTKTRVKSAMRETHWAGFLRNNANIEGRTEAGEVGMVMPDMSGPAASNKPAWTAEQKEIVWAETFRHGERHVK